MFRNQSLEIILGLRSRSRKSLATPAISYQKLCRYGQTKPRSMRADGEMPSMKKIHVSSSILSIRTWIQTNTYYCGPTEEQKLFSNHHSQAQNPEEKLQPFSHLHYKVRHVSRRPFGRQGTCQCIYLKLAPSLKKPLEKPFKQSIPFFLSKFPIHLSPQISLMIQ